jgi:hypothetical protein
MEGLLETAKFALAGTIIGVGAAYVGDTLNVKVVNPILKPTAGTVPTQAGMYGRMAFQVVAGTLVAGGVIFAGDKLLDQVLTGDDPLFRTFYLLTAFTSMSLVRQNTQTAMSGMNQMYNAITSAGTSAAAPAARSKNSQSRNPQMSSCGKGGCSSN